MKIFPCWGKPTINFPWPMVSAKTHSLAYTSTFLAPVNHLQV